MNERPQLEWVRSAAVPTAHLRVIGGEKPICGFRPGRTVAYEGTPAEKSRCVSCSRKVEGAHPYRMPPVLSAEELAAASARVPKGAVGWYYPMPAFPADRSKRHLVGILGDAFEENGAILFPCFGGGRKSCREDRFERLTDDGAREVLMADLERAVGMLREVWRLEPWGELLEQYDRSIGYAQAAHGTPQEWSLQALSDLYGRATKLYFDWYGEIHCG